MVRPGQLHVAQGVLEGLVAHPFLKHGDRHAAEHAVTAVGMPEGMGVASDRSIPEAVREPPSHHPNTVNDFDKALAARRCKLDSDFWLDYIPSRPVKSWAEALTTENVPRES